MGIFHFDIVSVGLRRGPIPLCLQHITGVRIADAVTVGVFI
jgi:hypothetical protein